MNLIRTTLTIVLLLLLSVFAAGCAGLASEAWERDLLARPEMQFDHDITLQNLHDHVYFSKEASSGGRGFGGGGCGCN